MNWWDKASNVLESIGPNDRIRMEQNDSLYIYTNSMGGQQDIGMKPKGLWYACGTEWLEWIISNEPEWKKPHIFKLTINPSNVLIISNGNEFDEFEKEYGKTHGDKFGKNILNVFEKEKTAYIDWYKVAQNYGGIEISPYQYSKRSNSMWYYGWDVASGCIWNGTAITKVQKII